MQKAQINIISSEGRQVAVSSNFCNVVSIPISNGVLNLSIVKMPAILKIIEFAHHHAYNPIISYPEQPLKSHELKVIMPSE